MSSFTSRTAPMAAALIFTLIQEAKLNTKKTEEVFDNVVKLLGEYKKYWDIFDLKEEEKVIAISIIGDAIDIEHEALAPYFLRILWTMCKKEMISLSDMCAWGNHVVNSKKEKNNKYFQMSKVLLATLTGMAKGVDLTPFFKE